MKKTLTLLSVITMCSLTSFAQRHVDLELTMISPANNQALEQGTAFPMNAVVKSLGSDIILPSDTIKLQMFLDNYPLSIASGSSVDSFFKISQRLMNYGDTVQVNIPMHIMFSGYHSFCLQVSLANNTASAVTDPNAANDKQCAFLNIFPTAVSSTSFENKVKVYPVPAKDVINWEAGDAFNPSQITLYDFMGRVAYRNATSGKSGQVNVSSFAKGVYQLQLIGADNKMVSKRIVVE